jgi:hydroxymethylpyrimidine pyrophosphatase-like HAD family hydrolase
MILLACDLDNTLIHGKKSSKPDDICVEYIDGKENCFMSQEAYKMLETLDEKICFVPVTARSVLQYSRLTIFRDKIPRYAVTSCGAVLLCDGKTDTDWQLYITEIVNSVSADMEAVFSLLKNDERVFMVKIIDNSFIFAISDESDALEQLILKSGYVKNMSVLRSYKKLYVVPKGIDKGAPLMVIKQRLGEHTLIAAGDSSPDIPMLNSADYALIPSDGLAPYVKNTQINVKMENSDFASWIFTFAKQMLNKYQSGKRG